MQISEEQGKEIRQALAGGDFMWATLKDGDVEGTATFGVKFVPRVESVGMLDQVEPGLAVMVAERDLPGWNPFVYGLEWLRYTPSKTSRHPDDGTPTKPLRDLFHMGYFQSRSVVWSFVVFPKTDLQDVVAAAAKASIFVGVPPSAEAGAKLNLVLGLPDLVRTDLAYAAGLPGGVFAGLDRKGVAALEAKMTAAVDEVRRLQGTL